MAGHSLGEYTALVCGGSLTIEKAAYLLHERGKFMQNAVPTGQGSMIAIPNLTHSTQNNISKPHPCTPPPPYSPLPRRRLLRRARHARLAAQAGAAMIIGTTGIDVTQGEKLERAARHVPLVWAPNMSVGVTLLLAITEQVAQVLDNNFDIEIVNNIFLIQFA